MRASCSTASCSSASRRVSSRSSWASSRSARASSCSLSASSPWSSSRLPWAWPILPEAVWPARAARRRSAWRAAGAAARGPSGSRPAPWPAASAARGAALALGFRRASRVFLRFWAWRARVLASSASAFLSSLTSRASSRSRRFWIASTRSRSLVRGPAPGATGPSPSGSFRAARRPRRACRPSLASGSSPPPRACGRGQRVRLVEPARHLAHPLQQLLQARCAPATAARRGSPAPNFCSGVSSSTGLPIVSGLAAASAVCFIACSCCLSSSCASLTTPR